MLELNNSDKKLLYELNWDCRQTNSKLAKKLRVSKQVINYRIKRLEEEKIIFGYSTLIDWRKLGYNSTRVYLKWKNITLEKEMEIEEYVRKNPFFMWSIKFEGEYDFAFYVWTKEASSFYEEFNKFLLKYQKYILKKEVCESFAMINYPMKFLIESKKVDEKIIGLGKEINFDKKDYELLKIFSFNARAQIVEISRKVKLTPKAVIYRIKNLEKKGIILGYNAIINTEEMGYSFYKIDFYLNDISRFSEMQEFAKAHKKIVYMMKTIGGPEYEVEAIVKGANELEELINEIRSKFRNEVEYFRFHRFVRTIKQVYLPGQLIEDNKIINPAI